MKGNPMDLFEAMSTQRAVRRLRPDPIPDEMIERVIQAACWGPTGGNQQPWKVIVVTDPDLKVGLRDIYAPEWANYTAGFFDLLGDISDEERAKWERIMAAGDHLAEHLHEAPAILLFCANTRAMAITDARLDRISIVGGASVYPAVQNALLACVRAGLGCTLTTLHCIREDEVKELLEIPEKWATAALVPIGYPVGGGHGPITRKPPSVMAARNTFRANWP